MLKIAHARAVALFATVWLWLLAWLAPRFAMAAALVPYDAGIRALNWPAIGLAALTGFAGGVAMLVLALATDQRVVREILAEGVRNAIASPITGLMAYGVLQAAAALGWRAPFEVSFVVLLLAGMGAVPLVGFFQGTASAGAPRVREGLIELAISWLQRWRAGPSNPGDPKP